jgi:cytochrome c oxidase assembly factor CtaG
MTTELATTTEALTTAHLFGGWRLASPAGALFAVALAASALAMARWTARAPLGDARRTPRTIARWLGWALLVLDTESGIATLGREHAAIDVTAQVALVVPIAVLLALGGLASLAEAGGGPRTRTLLAAARRSRALGLVASRPALPVMILIGSWALVLMTPLVRLAARQPFLGDLVDLWLLAAAWLLWSSLVGVDGFPPQPSFGARVVMGLACLPFYAILGIELTARSSPLLPGGTLAATHDGGIILWGGSSLLSLVGVAVVIVQWASSEERRQRASERAKGAGVPTEAAFADEVHAYRERLAALQAARAAQRASWEAERRRRLLADGTQRSEAPVEQAGQGPEANDPRPWSPEER